MTEAEKVILKIWGILSIQPDLYRDKDRLPAIEDFMDIKRIIDEYFKGENNEKNKNTKTCRQYG